MLCDKGQNINLTFVGHDGREINHGVLNDAHHIPGTSSQLKKCLKKDMIFIFLTKIRGVVLIKMVRKFVLKSRRVNCLES